MFHAAYEEMVRYASEGELVAELTTAKAEYVKRTGELFESDPSFERRIGSFLEWYVLDRPVGGSLKTPAKHYVDSVAGDMTTPDLRHLRELTKTTLSLFEFRKFKDEQMTVVDLLTDKKLDVFERRRPVGVESRDILEARLVPFNGTLTFSEIFYAFPRDGRRSILKAAKAFRKSGADPEGQARIDLVHRVAYYANRCERYSHVAAKDIFSELSWVAAAPAAG